MYEKSDKYIRTLKLQKRAAECLRCRDTRLNEKCDGRDESVDMSCCAKVGDRWLDAMIECGLRGAGGIQRRRECDNNRALKSYAKGTKRRERGRRGQQNKR
jgi:hypothetical protein